MRVTVTGKGGQLASEFEALKGSDVLWTFLSEADLNITDTKLVQTYFSKNPCDLVLNCAAYTQVDQAEESKDLCYAVNEDGVKNLLEACTKMNARLIHFSTDYVFDGLSENPYNENDIPNPQGVYGKSKLAGEILMQRASVKSIIIRTAWVYSIYGHNFVKTMLRLADERKEIGVVADQWGSPTSATDLAKMTLNIIDNQTYQWTVADLFHFSNEGRCSWFEFAQAILGSSIDVAVIKPLETKDYPTRAKRPQFSLLDKTKIKNQFGLSITPWEVALSQTLHQLEMAS